MPLENSAGAAKGNLPEKPALIPYRFQVQNLMLYKGTWGPLDQQQIEHSVLDNNVLEVRSEMSRDHLRKLLNQMGLEIQ